MESYIVNEIFRDMQCDFSSLKAFGFSNSANCYSYKEDILEGQFELTVEIFKNGHIETKLIERDIDEEYTLHLVEEARGELVNKVRKAYCSVLERIALRCFKKSVFKSKSALKLILHIRKTYGDEPQFLWEKFPKCAVLRRSDNKKWYGVLMVISAEKLGLDFEGDIELINLRVKPDTLGKIVDGKSYFNAYHMNKRHWVSLNLESSLSLREIYARVADSYELALNGA